MYNFLYKKERYESLKGLVYSQSKHSKEVLLQKFPIFTMDIRWLLLFLVITAVSVYAAKTEDTHQDDTEESENVDRNTLAQGTSQSRVNVGDISIPGGLVQLLANGGAVAAGILVVAAVALMVMPAFGLRMCSIFGGCDGPTYQAYSTSPNSVYSDYPGYSQGGTYNNPVYQRRSIEYIGPILKALGNAYEKYNRVVSPSILKKA